MVVGLTVVAEHSRLAEPGVDPWSASGLPSYDGVTISQNNDVNIEKTVSQIETCACEHIHTIEMLYASCSGWWFGT